LVRPQQERAMTRITIEDLIRLIEKHWVKKSGLIVSLILAVLVEAILLIAAESSFWISIGVVFATVLAIVSTWFISKKPPKTPKGKIGFLVSIAYTENEDSKKVREDFVIPLRQLVKSGKIGNVFHFIELPQHLAENIMEPDDAQALRIKCRAHFMLYGRVRLRTFEGKPHHVIDLEGAVAHNPIPENIGQAFAKEFAELLPRKVRISKENDFLSFQFTSEWADIVARYIIGIAAAFSGDLQYAETLYDDAQKRLKSKDPNFPIYLKLNERIPKRLSELNQTKAVLAHLAWVDTHEEQYIDQIEFFLTKINEPQLTNTQLIQLSAIHAFLKYRDIERAISILKGSKNKNYPEWHLSMAFLCAYKRNLQAAIRSYREAALFEIEPTSLTQIENFICWVLEEEPDKYQLHYCLGFFNWKIKGDNIRARKDFETFLKSGLPEEFKKEKELTTKWLKQIK